MRRRLAILAVALSAASAYPMSAFHATWQIRAALHGGDTETLARRVDWVGVRQSLKRSQAETRALVAEMSGVAGVARPGLWERVKAVATPWIAEPFIDRYVTAQGAPQLLVWRNAWRQKVRPSIGLGEPETFLSGSWLAGSALDRGVSLLLRVERVAFVSPTRMELAINDRYAAGRQWQAALELRDYAWTLTEVRIKRSGAVQDLRLTER